MTGVIKNVNYDRGFGFITADGIDYFFHRSALTDPTAFGGLREGDAMELIELENAERGWRANRVALAQLSQA